MAAGDDPEASEDAAHPVTQALAAEPGSPHHALTPAFRLEVVRGPDRGLTHSSAKERTLIGTHGSCDLVLHDPAVSRFHCEVTPAGAQFLIRDLGSRNGTSVDGTQIVAAYLKPGSIVRLGKSELVFELREAAVRLPISARDGFGVMTGRSLAMRRVFALLERAAESDSTVLLEGETGTGKEAASQSIHEQSARKAGPLVVVDCGAIPADLLESELFGHQKGAFTGAIASREGAFEAATGGTLLLDEIGELARDLQPKLLRALEAREVKRVGADRYHKVDVRVIAATNRDLRAQVNSGAFRADLYYRLAVIEVRLPPLRERPEDLPLLVERILESAPPRTDTSLVRTPEFLGDSATHSWPGNVRELRNHVERCLALRQRLPLRESAAEGADGLPAIDWTRPLKAARDAWLEAYEKRYLLEALRRNGDNLTAAARDAGINRITFYRLLWRHGMRQKT